MMIHVLKIVVVLILIVVFPLASYSEDAISTGDELHILWNNLLQKHTTDGQVDYLGFKYDEKILDSYLLALSRIDVENIDRNEELAIYINGYNAYTIKLILDNFKKGKPVKSIKDIGGLFSSPWSIEFTNIAGERLSLNDIENEIIRPRFKEKRIHFAVNCASISCPPLINVAYLPSKLDRQLEKQTREFVQTNKLNYFQGSTLYVSKIFKWYREDFDDDIISFFLLYGSSKMKNELSAQKNQVKIKFLPYDWQLNGIRK